mgnify:CR=1 FL=1
MIEWTLVTGATGFIGGEWVLRALARGEYVAAFVRAGREPHLLTHLDQLARQHAQATPSFDRLVVVPWLAGSEFSSFQLLRQSGVEKISSVIHAAADMAYALGKLPRSLETNLTLGVGLYDALTRYAPECRHFTAISTAYTCGLAPSAEIAEELHYRPKLVNGYQISKWSSELALTLRAQQGGPRLCILRPSIVVGEGARGVYTGKCFGFYMFLRAFALAKKAGAKRMQVPISPAAEVNLVPIDQLLCLLDELRRGEQGGVVHGALREGVSVAYMMEKIGELYGFPISFGKPKTFAEHLFTQQVRANMAFANTTFRFATATAEALLPKRNWQSLGEESFVRIVKFSKSLYLQKLHFDRADLSILPQLLPLKNISRLTRVMREKLP